MPKPPKKSRLSGARRFLVRRKWLSAAVLVALVGGGVAGVVLTGGSDDASAATKTTSQLVAATTGTVKESVSATGTLTPADEEDVDFSSSALITSVKVAVGDTVTKGEVLGTISTVSLKATLAQAQATLATAQATLTSDEDSSSSTDEQIAADKATITTDTQAVTEAEQAITDATLRSPIAGTVASVNVAVGDTSSGTSSSGGSGSGSSSTSGGSTTGGGSSTTTSSTSSSSSSSADFVVVGMKSWTASLSVDDTEVGLISKGLQAQITTDSSTSTIFGTVASVAVLSSSSSGSASYPVTVAVTGTPTGLHDGESATIAIVYKQASGLTVPTQAIHVSGNTSYVYVSANGTKTKRTVETGLASGGTTIVSSGLTSGEKVYVDTITRTPSTNSSSSTSGSTNRSGTGFGGTSGGGFGGGGSFGGGSFGGAGGPGGGN